jgi:hypothetical protein
MHPKREAILRQIEMQGLEKVVLLDGFDPAILGLVELPTGATVLAYSTKWILACLVQDSDGMTQDDAREYFAFNIATAEYGPGCQSPIFVQDEQDLS